MGRLSKEQVRENIFDAVVQITAEKGVGATSMADVARTAKVSAGTLYLHFESKEAMLQATYLYLKRKFYHSLRQEQASQSPRAVVEGVWRDLVNFLCQQPNAFLFLETAGAAQLLTEEQRAEIEPYQEELSGLIQSSINAEAGEEVSLNVALNLLIGSAMHLARRNALSSEPRNEAEVSETFLRVWRSLVTK
ncbi:TetR/AcrR family transcriptional regulator [Flexibacterium corallicola]|uniref:TetR/AcrR family transcriptional regulator n=1 Tax=Flexibacterium corallicola TaxID=3037259 RepID=UPI00286EF9AE|nr:TetR/AcrR family transcriptional regulator [Pseudovibrio sp. M1P-2-3]